MYHSFLIHPEAQDWEGAEQPGGSCTIPATNWVQLLQKMVCQRLPRLGGHIHDRPTPQLSLLPRAPRRKECVCPQGDIYRIMYSSFVYNRQTAVTTETSIHERTDKCSAVYSRTGELCLGNKTLNHCHTQQRGRAHRRCPSTARQS